MVKQKPEVGSAYEYVQLTLTHLSSPVLHSPKHLRFSLFRNIQKIDQTIVITASIKRDDTSLKGKILQPLAFRIPSNLKKFEDYLIVLYEVIYPVDQNDHLIEEEIGSLKIPLQKVVQIYKEKGDDHKPEQIKDGLSSDIELTYLITVHSDEERYNIQCKKKKFKEVFGDESQKMKKIESQLLPLTPLSVIEDTSNRLSLNSEVKPKKSFSQDQILEQEAEHVDIATPEFDSNISDFANTDQFIAPSLAEDLKKQSPKLIPSSTQIFETLQVIKQDEEIKDIVQRVRIIMNKIPPYKLMIILMGLFVIIILSPVVSPSRSREKSNKTKKP